MLLGLLSRYAFYFLSIKYHTDSALQIWGFETIDGQRYHTRRVVAAKEGEYVFGRLVYDWYEE